MAQAQNTTASLSPEMQILYNKVFLERNVMETTYDFLTEKEPMAKNSGKVMYFTRQTVFTPTTAALNEGVTPTGTAFSASTVSAEVKIYGDTTQNSTFFDLTGIDAGLKEKVSTFGQYAAEKMDLIRFSVMRAGATVQYANQLAALSALASTDTLDVADLRFVALTLKNKKAPKYGAPVGSLNKGGAYRAVLASKGYFDLLGDTTTGAFTAINLAVSSTETKMIKDQEIKRIAGFDVMESNVPDAEAAGSGGTLSAYANLFAGKGAVKEVSIGSGNPRIILKQPGASDTSNPLDMYNTLSWKVDAWTCIVANAEWLIAVKAV